MSEFKSVDQELTLKDMQKEAYRNSAEHGFHDDFPESNTPLRLMLIVSELSEALEEHRAGTPMLYFSDKGKPEGVAPEIADAVIRLGDLAETLGIDLQREVVRKMNYNRTRPFKHGGKAY